MSQNAPSELTPRTWLVIFGAFTSLFCTVGFLNSFGVFEEYYAEVPLANQSESTIGWIGAICLFCLFSISTIAGSLLDTFGPELLIRTGSVGTVLGVMMISLCTKLYQFILAQGFLLGISMSLVTWPAVGLIGQYIKRKSAGPMGIAIAGSSFGGVIWPIAIKQLLYKPNIGFGWTMRIVGFIMIPLLLFSCIVCNSPPKAPVVIEDATKIEDGSVVNPTDPIPEKVVDRKAQAMALYKKPSMRLLCLAVFFIYFGMFAPFFYTTSYAVKKGFSTSFAFYTVSIVNGASFFGRIIPGIVADKLGRFNCLIIATLLAGVIALCWTKVDSVTGLAIWSAAYGFALGGILSLQQASAAQVATPSTIGLAIGSVAGCCALSAMANVPISGALVEKYGYLALSIFTGVSLLVGAILLLLARFAQTRTLLAVI
ncbi:uncharacterized protein N7483_012578 [Penicillium malachiteum]|uniref:uncharacterized protein n=1 Tax=Penicillium malachiteum TaxID=1324776 RepID=UPI002548A3C2|nr:uncharacterized protein N7483_012578 [Penicillium malachiteum]KAJ5715397.1 hypothetical protein N7483_012578 [Penicillium malachiteum]